MPQVATCQEVTEYLGRKHYERRKGEFKGYCNSYEPRHLKTAQGTIETRVPQLRNTDKPFHSVLLEARATRSETLEELVRRMYVRELSQRDIAETSPRCSMKTAGTPQSHRHPNLTQAAFRGG